MDVYVRKNLNVVGACRERVAKPRALSGQVRLSDSSFLPTSESCSTECASILTHATPPTPGEYL